MRFNTVAYNGRSNNGKCRRHSRCATGPSVKPAITTTSFLATATKSGASQIQFGCSFRRHQWSAVRIRVRKQVCARTSEFFDDFSLKDGPANRNRCIDQVSPPSGDTFPTRAIRCFDQTERRKIRHRLLRAATITGRFPSPIEKALLRTHSKKTAGRPLTSVGECSVDLVYQLSAAAA